MTKASSILTALLLCAGIPSTWAQVNTSQTAEEEAVRRQEQAILLRKTIESAQAAQKQGDLASAATLYEKAWEAVEILGSGVGEPERAATVIGFVTVRQTLAERAARGGNYEEANTQINRALRIDPNNLKARNFKRDNEKRVEGQRRMAPSPGALAQLPEVRTNITNSQILVNDGKLFFEAGMFERAEKKLNEAIELDPNNAGANFYLNKVKEARYGIEARKREINVKDKIIEVEKAWNTPPLKPLPFANPFATTNRIYTGTGRQAIQHKLDRIVLDEVKFDGIPLSEAIKILDEESRERDPEKKGVNFIISSLLDQVTTVGQPTLDPATGQLTQPPPSEPVDVNNIQIRLTTKLRNIRLADALDAMIKTAEKPIKYSIEDYAIVFSQKLPEAIPLYTRRFRVDPNTFQQGLESVTGFPFGDTLSQGGGGGQGGGGVGGGGGGQGGQGGQGIFSVPRVSVTSSGGLGGQGGGGGGGGAGGGGGGGQGIGIQNVTYTNQMANVQVLVRNFFIACGLNFPVTAVPGGGGLGGAGGGGGGGGFAQPGGLGGLGGGDPNADQKALFFNDRTGILFVRATLTDLDVIEQAIQALNVAPPQVTIEAKFAEISQSDSKAIGFDWFLGNFLLGGGIGGQAGTAPTLQGAATAANPGGAFPGYPANGVNPLSTYIPTSGNDQHLSAGIRNQDGNQSRIPAVATLTGILTDPQFRVVIRALQQRDGVDLLAAPKVTTLSGRQAQVQVADVRTIVTGLNGNQSGGGGGGGGGAVNIGGGGGGVGSTIIPSTQVLPFGPILDVIPYVSSDDVSIQLTLIPGFTEFIGYDDPGDFVAQVQSVSGSQVGQPLRAQLPLPRLRARTVTTSAIVWDGQTVVLGGLISEDVKKQKDKIPVLGDLPLIGRLFRSEASLTQKKNLLIFVTPTIVDPAGMRIHDPNNLPYDPNAVPANPGGVVVPQASR